MNTNHCPSDGRISKIVCIDYETKDNHPFGYLNGQPGHVKLSDIDSLFDSNRV